jgi:hypothetical protein
MKMVTGDTCVIPRTAVSPRYSLNVGSMIGCSTCRRACWISRSTTVGMPSSRVPLIRRPFRHKARSPQVRTRSFPAQPPDLRRLILGHESFAVVCPLALIGIASYPVLVHRLAEDFHLQDRAHAGRTNKKPADLAGGLFSTSAPCGCFPLFPLSRCRLFVRRSFGLLLRCGAPRRHDPNVAVFPAGVVIQL